MNVIIFKVKGNTLTRVGGVDPASAGGKQTRFRFLFDDNDWKGVTTATVTQFFDIRESKNIIISDIRNGVAECELHSDLRAISGVLWVGITGVNPQSGQTLDCVLTAVPVGHGGAVSEVISTKLYLQFLDYVLGIKEQIKAIEDKLIDEDNPITTSLIQNLAITPEKLDRKYWEKIAPVDTVIKKADDLFNVTGFINSGRSIALINVDMTVNIGEDEVELVNINGFCYAVGIKFDSGDTVYLNNITDGTQWKINRYNEGSELVPIYKLQCFRFGVSDGTITPEKLDRKYLERCVTEYGETISTFAELFEKVGRINRGGNLGFVKLYVSDSEKETVLNYGYISGDFMAVGTPTNSDICLINLRSGENWTVSKNDEEKYSAYKVDALTPRVVQLEKNAKITVLGDINSMSELMTYSFSKDYLYHFYATGSLGDLIGEGYCFGRYSTEENPETGALTNKFLEVFNFTTLKTWKINFKEGTAKLMSGFEAVNDIGTMEIEDFQSFSFKEDVLYKFDYGDYSDCLGVYENSLDSSVLKFISLRNGKTGEVDTTTGELTELGGTGAGADGKSAYEIALDLGFEGTKEEWLLSLKGADGAQGPQGEKGDKGDRGNSGVYIGSGDMPDDCNVQIDPTGEAVDLSEFATKEYVDNAIENIETGGASGSGSSETLVFEHKWENHIAHTVTAIDFENFTMTLDDTTGIPTDTTGKNQNYFQLDMFGGNAILMNVMPIELIRENFKVQAIGDNKVQFLDNNNTVIQFTDTGNIDLTKFKLWVFNKSQSQAVNVENLETNHKYHAIFDFEGFHHITASIGLPECVAEMQNGYALQGLRSSNLYSLYTAGFNHYNDTVSFRSCADGCMILPAKIEVYITPELYNGQRRALLELTVNYCVYDTTKYRIKNQYAYAKGWANNEVSKIVFKAGNAGWHGNAKARIYDCGEVDLW